MSYQAITTDEITGDKPGTDSLFSKIKDNFDYLYALSGDVIDVPNGTFEIDADGDGVPDNWTRSLYAGGSGAFDTTTPAQGAKAYKFTRTSGAGNGGGYLECGYLPISEYISPKVQFKLKASAAGMKNIVRLRYFDKDKVDLSADEDIYSSTSNPTSWTSYTKWGVPPTNARYMKIRLIGGYTDTDVAGDIYFDDVHYNPLPEVLYDNFTIARATNNVGYADLNSASIKLPKGFTVARLPVDLDYSDTGAVGGEGDGGARYRIGTTYSTELLFRAVLPIGSNLFYTKGVLELDISALSGAQTLYLQSKANGPTVSDSAGAAKTDKFAEYVRLGG